jgi:catechol 2,3-dioxygenase-like lactoylglutathione lyase family enzyme
MERARPVLNQVNVIGSDLDATLAFYRRLGVDIPEDRVWRTATGAHHITAAEGQGESAGLDLDSATFAQVWNTGWRGRTDLAGRVVVGFGVASRQAVDDIYGDMLSAGYRGLQGPHDAFWGARYAILEDPDGLAVGLMSPISAAHRAPPPQL